MGYLVWIVIALLFVAVLVVLAARRTRQLLPDLPLPPGELLPPAPVQRLAKGALWVIAALVAAAVAVIVVYGPQAWRDSDPVRWTVTGLMLAALLVLLWFNLRVKALRERDDGSFDERDDIILARACGGVGGAMMGVTAVWMIALIESHRATGLVPSYWLHLLFWSLVMTNVLASMGGIVLSYRRA